MEYVGVLCFSICIWVINIEESRTSGLGNLQVSCLLFDKYSGLLPLFYKDLPITCFEKTDPISLFIIG